MKQLCGNSSSVEGEKAIAMSAFVMIHGPSIAIFNPTQTSSSPALFCTHKENPSAFNEQIEIGKNVMIFMWKGLRFSSQNIRTCFAQSIEMHRLNSGKKGKVIMPLVFRCGGGLRDIANFPSFVFHCSVSPSNNTSSSPTHNVITNYIFWKGRNDVDALSVVSSMIFAMDLSVGRLENFNCIFQPSIEVYWFHCSTSKSSPRYVNFYYLA